ncbi:NAD(P)H-binding protein [Streptomyces marincola]|uniref:NAD(P)H-binding protein n=1 Tax=Streptomyces marincola TaxID=2878388 RepID=UPI001CF30EBD|nr:NAD(P)H-binding protein [Streptomyces marincola]UCM87042.1 NAD(P)H-binding protein [Streptomyces marincola]
MIGILGASGAVGRHAVAALARAGAGPLRLGARRPGAIRVDPAWRDATAVAADAGDADSLAAFAAGCRVVLNCAGPSYALKDTVARAALAAGADYVDVLGDDPAREALLAAGGPPPGRTVLLSAGVVPGLSALLHRRLTELSAGDASPPTRLVTYAGGLEPATRTVAADILLSLNAGGVDGEPYGHPLAAWREGRRRPGVLRVDENAEVPYYPERVAVQPLLTAEVERGAAAAGLAEADWYNVFPGRQVRALFTALPTLPADTPRQREEVIDRVIRASEIDLAGADPYYRLVVTLSGPDRSRTAHAHTDDSYRLTAAVAAHAVLAVRDGRVAPGLHFAGDVLAPREVIDGLVATGAAEVAIHESAGGHAAPGDGFGGSGDGFGGSGGSGGFADGFEDGAL